MCGYVSENNHKTLHVLQVGLESRRVHGSFYTAPSSVGVGTLVLNRRCEGQTCEGHCTCAPQDQKCDSEATCVNVTGKLVFIKVYNSF